MSQPNLRRAFRNDRMRALYDQAVAHGWTGKRDGAGHVKMYSPDGQTSMWMSATARAQGRHVLNTEAVFKRWLREQQEAQPVANDRIEGAITRTVGREAYKHLTGEEPPEPPAGGWQEVSVQQVYVCADGCGKPVKERGGYARGHHPNSKKQGQISAAKRIEQPKPKPATTKVTYTDTVPVIRETMTLAALDDYLEALREVAEVEVVEESPGRISGVRFSVEADDLWDLRELLDEVVDAVNTHSSESYVPRREKVTP